MTNHYLNLMSQVDMLRRHNRRGSYTTRARYYEAMQRFCRFFHDLISTLRYELPENSGLFLQRRTFGEVDWTWSKDEFERMLDRALQANRRMIVLFSA